MTGGRCSAARRWSRSRVPAPRSSPPAVGATTRAEAAAPAPHRPRRAPVPPRRVPGPSSSAPSSSAPAGGGTVLGPTSDVPVGGGMVFKDAKVVVTQPTAGQYKGFSAICTHQGNPIGSVAGWADHLPVPPEPLQHHRRQPGQRTGAVAAPPGKRRRRGRQHRSVRLSNRRRAWPPRGQALRVQVRVTSAPGRPCRRKAACSASPRPGAHLVRRRRRRPAPSPRGRLGVRVVGQVERGPAGHVRRGHRGAAHRRRAGRCADRGDVHARREEVHARAVVGERRPRRWSSVAPTVIAAGPGRRDVAGVRVVVAGGDRVRDARVDRALTASSSASSAPPPRLMLATAGLLRVRRSPSRCRR